ncbi:MAG: ferric reductase-like transmembrane domain-containing protein [Mycobacteriales bacterium]
MSHNVPVLWLVARAAGLTAFLFLTLTVILGIAAGARSLPSWWPRFLTQGVHRGSSAVALLLLAVHVVTLVIDPYVVLTWTDIVIPFQAGYQRTWSALGTIAVDLLLVITLTSLVQLRVRLGPRLWRAIHVTSYAAWVVALVHGLGAGTDTKMSAIKIAYAAAAGLVLIAFLIRTTRRPLRTGVRLTTAVGER